MRDIGRIFVIHWNITVRCRTMLEQRYRIRSYGQTIDEVGMKSQLTPIVRALRKAFSMRLR